VGILVRIKVFRVLAGRLYSFVCVRKVFYRLLSKFQAHRLLGLHRRSFSGVNVRIVGCSLDQWSVKDSVKAKSCMCPYGHGTSRRLLISVVLIHY